MIFSFFQQMIVIKIQMTGNKARCTAMELAAGADGKHCLNRRTIIYGQFRLQASTRSI
jgi:hypothetical protein